MALKGISTPELDAAVSRMFDRLPSDKSNAFGMAITEDGVAVGVRFFKDTDSVDWQAKMYGGVDLQGKPIVGLEVIGSGW